MRRGALRRVPRLQQNTHVSKCFIILLQNNHAFFTCSCRSFHENTYVFLVSAAPVYNTNSVFALFSRRSSHKTNCFVFVYSRRCATTKHVFSSLLRRSSTTKQTVLLMCFVARMPPPPYFVFLWGATDAPPGALPPNPVYHVRVFFYFVFVVCLSVMPFSSAPVHVHTLFKTHL